MYKNDALERASRQLNDDSIDPDFFVLKGRSSFRELHSPKDGDHICHKCKMSCGNPVSEKRGYGERFDRIKYTYYCNRCGYYYTVWR